MVTPRDDRLEDLERLAELFATRHAVEIDLSEKIRPLRSEVASMTHEEFLVKLMGLAAGRERDGHTGFFPLAQSDLELWPIQIYEFADGWRVVAAAEQYGDLVGGEVTALAGGPVAETAKAVAPLVSRDNEASLRGRLPQYLVIPDVLVGLGLEPSLEVDGETLSLETVSSDEYANEFGLFYPLVCPPLPSDSPLWSLEESGDFVILKFGRVVFSSDGRTTAELAEELLALVDRAEPRRVVFDLRDNPGGELPAARPLVEALQLIGDERPGTLRLLVNRCTFSAAALITAELLATTDAVTVGEPMGGAPQIWADARPYVLEGSGATVHIATGAYEAGTPGQGVLIEPDVDVPITWQDWSMGRDRVLEEALGS